MEQQQRIRIIYILTKLELGGAQKVCLSLVKHIARHRFIPGLVSGSQGVLALEAQEYDTYFITSFKREVSIASIYYEVVTFASLVYYLRAQRRKYQKVIVHTHSTKAGILGRWAAFIAGVSTRVHTVHGFGFHNYQVCFVRWMIIAIEWCTLFITTHVVCVSRKDKEYGSQLFNGFAQKSSIIRAAVNNNSFFRAAREICSTAAKPITVGVVACFKPQKNLLDLLHALKVAIFEASCTIRLEIVGDGQLRPEIESYITDHNLSEYISLLGWQQNVAPIMNTWDIYASTALWEGLPCAIVEARLVGLPVVAYNVGGIAEVIEHGKNGLLHRPHDTRSFARSIVDLATDSSRRKRLASYNDNLREFTENYMIDEHAKLYRSL